MNHEDLKVKVYILATPGKFRGEVLLNKLKKIGLDYEIVWGLDAAEPGFTLESCGYDEKKSLIINRRKMAPGEVACAYGHQLMYEAALDSAAEIFLFLEDDADIHQELIIAPLLDGLKSTQSFIIERNSEITKFSTPSPHLIRLVELPYETVGYIMSRAATRRLCSNLQKYGIYSTADWPHCTPISMNLFRSSTTWISQDKNPEFSLIGERQTQENQSRASRVFSLFARISGSRSVMGKFHGVPIKNTYFNDVVRPILYRLLTSRDNA
jgi:hypothetical protein